MYSTLTSKGQITLPKQLRDALQLSAGDRIEFDLCEDESIRLVAKRAHLNRLKGMLPKPNKAVSLEDMQRAIEDGAA